MKTRDVERLYSSMRFQGDGTTKIVPLTFDLTIEDSLLVDFGEGLVTSGYSVDYDVTPVTVIFEQPLPLGKTITIRRQTFIEEVKHIFQSTGNAQGGSDFTAKNIDENFEQITRASQDAMDSQVLASETLEEMAGIRDDAIDARDKAKQSETNAKQSEVNSKYSELKAEVSETNAKSSETKVKTSELNAKDSESKAKLSETNAKASEVNAKESENNSKQSESNAKASEVSASTDASQVAQDKTQVAQDKVYVTSLKEDVVRLHSEVDVSADNAKSSELASKGSEELARKWATNPVDVPVVGSEYSAYHWSEQAKKNSASPSKFTLINAGIGLTGGGNLESDVTINLGLPSSLSSESINEVIGSTHSHKISKASLSEAGLVKLTSVIDDSEEDAVTPKAVNTVKKKADQLPNPEENLFPVGQSSTAYRLVDAEEMKTILGVPVAVNVVQTTGTSTTNVMSQKTVTDQLLGVGQTWKDMKSQRAVNTTYTNTTGRSIEVVIYGTGDANHQVQVATPVGTPPVILGQIGGDADRESISFIVPDGSAYRVHGTGSIERWSELR